MRRLKLHTQIAIAMALGAGIGLGLRAAAASGMVPPDLPRNAAAVGEAIGGVFLRLLQMLVVPLVVSSLIGGVAQLGDLRALGRLGAKTLGLYLGTSLIAILTGQVFVSVIRPGAGADLDALLGDGPAPAAAVTAQAAPLEVLWEQLVAMIPKNPIEAASQGAMLPMIFYSLALGVFLNVAVHRGEGEAREAARTVERFFVGLFDVMMRMTTFVVHLAPIGVFGFLLFAVAGAGLEAFRALGLYALTVGLALAFHAAVSLPLLLRAIAGRSPRVHARAMVPALLTAFSTASSNATLPLTMECVERAGVPKRVGAFVLPLGATINMDGTALYEAVAVVFIAQVYGVELGLGQQAVIALTALLVSVGAAGIPHAGMVMMVIVLTAVGLPSTGVALVLAVDRVLDMMRTTVNVWSDSVVASIVGAGEPDAAADSPLPPASGPASSDP